MLNFIDVSVGQDLTSGLFESLKKLANKTVMVGISETNNNLNGKIKNAELLYIQSHGVRKKSMINEMAETMGTKTDGTPFSPQYDEFSNNMSEGMSYSTAYQLYVQSTGSPLWNIPPRPVLEPAIENCKTNIANEMKKVAETALDGENTDGVLRAVGLLAEGQVRDWFVNPLNGWPENSKYTIKKKGSDLPLINVGNLRKSITFEVADGNE